MSHPLRRCLGLAFLAALLLPALGCTGIHVEDQATAAPSAAARDGVFIHVSHADPQRVLMALRLAEVMASDKDVLMYFDIDGVNVLRKGSENYSLGDFPDKMTLLTRAQAAGARIYACPACMQLSAIPRDQLLDGVEVAYKEAFFDFTAGRILTLDY